MAGIKLGNFVRSRFFRMLMIIAVVLLLGMSFLSNAITIHNRRADLAALQQQVAQAQAANDDLQRVVDYTKTNDFIEQAARELGYIKPGEIRFIAE